MCSMLNSAYADIDFVTNDCSENALCGCTPAHHGFTDNRTGMGDFAGLNETKSYT